MTVGRIAFLLTAIALAQSPSEQQLQDLLTEARHVSPQRQAELLIQADALADKVTPAGDHVRIEGFDLTYRGKQYQHDLLKTVIRTQEGTLWGANALVALVSNPQSTLNYKAVLNMLASKHWQAFHDARLDRIRGDAYGTWWSTEHAETARINAIAAYERVLQVQPQDSDLRRRVAELKARHVTN